MCGESYTKPLGTKPCFPRRGTIGGVRNPLSPLGTRGNSRDSMSHPHKSRQPAGSCVSWGTRSAGSPSQSARSIRRNEDPVSQAAQFTLAGLPGIAFEFEQGAHRAKLLIDEIERHSGHRLLRIVHSGA